jgi:putative DNA primase/helicase
MTASAAGARMGERPETVTVDPDRIPAELKTGRRHVLWRWFWKGKGWTKPPYRCDGSLASTIDPGTWCNFDEARAAYRAGSFDGIGVVLDGSTDLVGIDFDHVRNPGTGTIEVWAEVYTRLLATYTEVSPSGTGLRSFVHGNLAQDGMKQGPVEIYKKGRYLTLTGFALPGTPPIIESRQSQLDELIAAVFGTPGADRKTGDRANSATITEIESALEYIASDDRKVWLFTGMALHHELGDGGRPIWDKWSQRSPKFDEREQTKAWSKFRTEGNSAGAIGIGTVFFWARQAGWVRPESEGEVELPSEYCEFALAQRFVREHGSGLLHVARFGSWFVFDPARGVWLEDEKLLPFTLAKRTLTAAAREAYDAIMNSSQPDEEKARRIASALTSAEKVAAVVNLSRSDPKIAAAIDQFDIDPWLLNTPGGVVDLRNGSIRKATRSDFFTKCTVVAPRKMPTPLFDQFLLDIMGWWVPVDDCRCAVCTKSAEQSDPEVRKALHQAEVRALAAYLKRLYGYCLTGEVKTHVLPLEIGSGGNGKGVINDLISRDIMGLYPIGYAADIPIEALLNAKGERHPTELMSLYHTRLALARETDTDIHWNEGRVKMLSGADDVTARKMRQDFVTFAATHKLVVFGNSKPHLRGADQSAWKRRLNMIEFPQQWDEVEDKDRNIGKADIHLADKLHAEAPGILHKLIEGCIEYQKGGLRPPATILEASNRYLRDQNRVAQFIDDRCEKSEDAQSTVADLWTAYQGWASQNKVETGARHEFNERLRRAGIKVLDGGRNHGICKGIAIRMGDRDEL